MMKSRKSSGSSSFLNRLQRNAQFSASEAFAPEEDSADEDAGTIAPEALLLMLTEMRSVPIGVLAERLSAQPVALIAPLEELRKNDCVLPNGPLADPATVVTITDIGMKTASFARIARA